MEHPRYEVRTVVDQEDDIQGNHLIYGQQRDKYISLSNTRRWWWTLLNLIKLDWIFWWSLVSDRDREKLDNNYK